MLFLLWLLFFVDVVVVVKGTGVTMIFVVGFFVVEIVDFVA